MIISTVCLDFVPNVIGQIFQSVTQMNLLDFIGPYTLVCGTLNVTICSGIYYRALKTSISPNTVTPAAVVTVA
uniref:Uncharacterized protein n=1 Tax=Panagrolaimus davidi TaxID=227884 RepID=A0A914Q7X9_9BILA